MEKIKNKRIVPMMVTPTINPTYKEDRCMVSVLLILPLGEKSAIDCLEEKVLNRALQNFSPMTGYVGSPSRGQFPRAEFLHCLSHRTRHTQKNGNPCSQQGMVGFRAAVSR
jgi:hypothetical protein